MEEELDPQRFGVTPELFKEWAAPRFGNANPQKIKSNVWEWLVRSKLSAYGARQKMNGPSIFTGAPTWSFDRFGQSVTEMPDGRIVYIAGEHEDFYDPDFYIYNDVVVTRPEADGAIDFYCYRKSDFPPTDFHTATLVDDTIVIIGSLGYREERNLQDTQVYRLSLDNFEICKVKCLGISPGWIHRHIATLSEDQKSIILTKGKIPQGNSLVENIDDWKLHLDDWSWQRLTSRNWTQFAIWRKDKKTIHLWDIRHALWSLERNMEDFYREDMDRLEKFMGYRPDVKLVKDLYSFDLEHDELHQDEDQYNLFWMYTDGVRIRFTEEMNCLQVMIEGSLPPEKVSLIKQQLLDKLSALVNSACELEEY